MDETESLAVAFMAVVFTALPAIFTFDRVEYHNSILTGNTFYRER
jgi:hypothetical protein